MDDKIYPSIKNTIFLCLMFLGIQIGLEILIDILRVVFEISDTSLFNGILMAVTSIISFGVVLLFGFRKTKRKFNDVFKFNKVSPFLWIAIVIFMVGFVIVSSELDNILNFILPMPKILRDIFEILIIEQRLIVSIIVVAVIPAFTEELFFRGLILDGFTKNYTQRKAILLSALFFGIIHLNPWQFLSGFIIGLFSAWICIKTKSIWLSIYIHLFNNALYTIAVKFKNYIPIKGFNADNTVAVVFQPLWFDLMGLAILAIGIILLKKGFSRKAKNSA